MFKYGQRKDVKVQEPPSFTKTEKFQKVFIISKENKGAKLHKPHKDEQRQKGICGFKEEKGAKLPSFTRNKKGRKVSKGIYDLKEDKGAKLHKPHKGEQRQIFYDFKKQSSYTSKTTVLFQPSVQGVLHMTASVQIQILHMTVLEFSRFRESKPIG